MISINGSLKDKLNAFIWSTGIGFGIAQLIQLEICSFKKLNRIGRFLKHNV